MGLSDISNCCIGLGEPAPRSSDRVAESGQMRGGGSGGDAVFYREAQAGSAGIDEHLVTVQDTAVENLDR